MPGAAAQQSSKARGAPGSGAQARASIVAKATLPEAIEVARPFMENTLGRLDVGSALLTLWSAKHLKRSDVAALAETSPALFQKDPDAERGKRLCFSGLIGEIRAEKDLSPRLIDDHASPLIPPAAPKATADSVSVAGTTPDGGAVALALAPTPPIPDYLIPDGGKVFFATVDPKPPPPTQGQASPAPSANPGAAAPETVEVIAIGSTGTLVNGDPARACGVLTGATLLSDPASVLNADVPRYRIVGFLESESDAREAEQARVVRAAADGRGDCGSTGPEGIDLDTMQTTAGLPGDA